MQIPKGSLSHSDMKTGQLHRKEIRLEPPLSKKLKRFRSKQHDTRNCPRAKQAAGILVQVRDIGPKST